MHLSTHDLHVLARAFEHLAANVTLSKAEQSLQERINAQLYSSQPNRTDHIETGVISGAELKARRKKLKLTQAKLAACIGVSAGFIGEMERGEKIVSHRTAIALSSIIPRNE